MSILSVGSVNVNDECELEVKANSKRVGSKAWDRYEGYAEAKNVGEYLKLGGLKADLRYDCLKGFVILKEKIVKGKKISM